VTEDPFEESGVIERTYQNNLGDPIDLQNPDWRWCKEYLDNLANIQPDYMKTNGLSNVSVNRYFQIQKYKRLVSALGTLFRGKYEGYRLGNPGVYAFSRIKRAISRDMKLRIFPVAYDEPSDNEDYFLYPLHYHPEASTSVMSPDFLDEYDVIRNIAFNLPFGAKLYVKDHK